MSIQPQPAVKQRGFTLIEMLIVLGVILILVSIGIPNFLNALKRARISSAKVQLMNYKAAVAEYHTDTRQYPPSGSWHLYYILSGESPFSNRLSKRYNPPYIEFTPKEVGKKFEGNQQIGYDQTYDEDKDLQIKLGASPQQLPAPVGSSNLFIASNLQKQNNSIKFFALLDPWNRPVIYISPDDLEDWFEGNTTESVTKWEPFMAISENKRVNKKGTEKNVPFAMNSGQLWSAGPDGETAKQNLQFPGLFQPGNLSADDGRDDDLDGLTDLSDPQGAAEGSEYSYAEDDINSWN